MSIKPFPMIEKAIKEVLVQHYEPADDANTGGDLDVDKINAGTYFWIGLIPGAGSTDETSGQWMADLDVFGSNYAEASGHALALEALLLAGRFTTSEMIIDNVYQNSSPAEGPWDNDAVFRISASYVFTARRR